MPYKPLFLTLVAALMMSQVTLEQFGTQKNANRPLQANNRERFSINQPLRTNDYQPLQQVRATARQVIRMGTFYVSQGDDGPGLTLPAFQTNDMAAIETPPNNLQMVFDCTERGANAFRRLTRIPSTQTMLVSYSLITNDPPANFNAITVPSVISTVPLDNQTITDFNVVGNAYHDMYYNNLTPLIKFSSLITRVDVDGVQTSLPATGTKFKLTLSNGQTWLLYFERGTPVTLVQSINLASGVLSLTAQGVFTGFVRAAALQVTAVPTANLQNLGGGFDPWATSIIAQTRPATPIAMYLLWPTSWTALVGPQITRNLNNSSITPDCTFSAELLPVLARTDFKTSQFYLFGNALTNLTIGSETNQFLTYFMTLVAAKQAAEITTYQTTSRPPPPTPAALSAATTEATFDTYRTRIPLYTDVTFTTNSYSWTYTNDNNINNPLIIFPGYKTLSGTSIAGFGYLDPVKGTLLGTEAANNAVTFTEGALPDFYAAGNFFPTTLSFTQDEIGLLEVLYTQTGAQAATSTDVLSSGRELYKLALMSQCLIQAESQRRNGTSLSFNNTRTVVELIKSRLLSWLVNRDVPDFFIGDNLTGGVCTTAGMGSLNEEVLTLDEGNALYNNHHYQYGYWLACAAFIIDWDRQFITQPSNRFIRQNVTIPATGATVPIREVIDLLWRDSRNYNKTDAQLPFNRYGNPWEGHSTENGFLYTVSPFGRIAERFGEDFHSWMGTNQYARAVLREFAEAPPEGFTELVTFSDTNMQLTATAAKLVFQDSSWIFTGPFATNITVGDVFDTKTTATTPTIVPGTACPLRIKG